MLDRLKSLPLTIFLTVLIWMYAEAQFTSVSDNVHINIRLFSPAPDVALSVADKNQSRGIINLVVKLQGPKKQLDDLMNAAQQLGPEDDFEGLTFRPKDADLAKGRTNGMVQVTSLSVLNQTDYFRSRGVTVTSATPALVQLRVDPVQRLKKRVEFRSSPLVDRFTLSPDSVEVAIPSATLAASGGDEKLTVFAELPPDRNLTTLPPDTDQTLPVRFVARYPGTADERVRVFPSQGEVTLRTRRQMQSAITIPDIPVWVSGPPILLSRYDVDIQPRTVNITVSGSTALIDAMRRRVEGGGSRSSGLAAYLDLTPDDRPGEQLRRTVRYIVPEGYSLLTQPAEIGFRLFDRSIPGAPSTQGSANVR